MLKNTRARKNCLEQKGFKVLLEGFLVGSLGTWDPENDSLLTKLGIARKYGTLFKKLCVRDAILGSYGVWAARCRRGGRGSHNST